MSRYKAYSEYRDSGLQWLGRVPTHWAISKLRYKFAFGKGLTITKENLVDDGIPCVNYGEVHSKFGFEVDPAKHALKCVDESYLKDFPNCLLGKGDFVFADTSEDIDGSGNFTQLTSDTVTFAGYHTIIARPESRTNTRYLAYLFDAKEFRAQIRLAVKGVKVFSITQAILRGADISVPSDDEQKKIAAFLDHETAKIDALIEKQQRLIELLKEKRQAVISHAVTKGLNPNAPMKDSGVEWLGEVPAHWGITQIKYVAELNPRRALVELKPSLECNFVPMEKLKTESLLLDEIRTVDEVISGYTSFCDEDILMAKVTPCFENKNIAIAKDLKNGIGFGSTEIYVLRTQNRVSNSFLLYRLQENEFMRMATGAMTGAGGLKRVPTDFVNSFKFAIPPIPEQLEICSFIKKQKDKYDSLESLAKNQVELLQERRTALISAAVTGKIDVRDWQAAA